MVKMLRNNDGTPDKLLDTAKLSVDGSLSHTGLVDDFSSAINAKKVVKN
jgi:hypothetical protein